MLYTPFNADETFDIILDYYDLKKCWQYFLLYNKSEYKFGYHGVIHVKNACCTIVEISKQLGPEVGLEHNLIRELLQAMIFHDTNYLAGAAIRSGEDGEPIFADKDYDDKNIQAATRAVQHIAYHDGPYIGLSKESLPNIIKAIESTRWPSKELDRDKWDLVKTIMINADHSMVLYDDYIPLVVALFTNELGITDLEEARQAALDWLDHVQFDFHNLKEKWDTLRPELIKSMSWFFDTCKIETMNGNTYLVNRDYDTLYNTSIPNGKFVLKDSSQFISMASGYKYPFEKD